MLAMAAGGRSVSLAEFEELLSFFPEPEQKYIQNVLFEWHMLLDDSPDLDLNELARNTLARIKKNFLAEHYPFIENILCYGRDLLFLERAAKIVAGPSNA